MGETRVDLLHLFGDLRDAYPGSLEETVLTEIVANSLDFCPPWSSGPPADSASCRSAPTGRRAPAAWPERRHVALTAAMTLSRLAVEPHEGHSFATTFLAAWGAMGRNGR
jgi:hypothetical protein